MKVIKSMELMESKNIIYKIKLLLINTAVFTFVFTALFDILTYAQDLSYATPLSFCNTHIYSTTHFKRLYERWPWLIFKKQHEQKDDFIDYNSLNPFHLQKADGKWHIINNKTDEIVQSGNNILLGSFYDTEAEENTRYFISLDGHRFFYSENFGSVKGKHFNMFFENGSFYGLKTMYRNPFRELENPTTYWFDFGIRETKDFDEYIWHYPNGAYVEADPNTNPDGSDRGSVNRNSPEWFIDNGHKYVFYSVDIDFDDTYEILHIPNNRSYAIYRSEILDFNTDTAATPVKMNFDILPSFNEGDYKRGFTHPFVVNAGDVYVMFVKDEHVRQENPEQGNAIWVYRSDDLLNWNFVYTISETYLPQSLTTRTDPETDIIDTDHYTGEPREFYRYYSSPCVIKSGTTWNLYVEELTFSTTGSVDFEDRYSGKIVHLVTDDILSGVWKNMGYISVDNKRVRGGSILTIIDSEAEHIIQKIFNR